MEAPNLQTRVACDVSPVIEEFVYEKNVSNVDEPSDLKLSIQSKADFNTDISVEITVAEPLEDSHGSDVLCECAVEVPPQVICKVDSFNFPSFLLSREDNFAEVEDFACKPILSLHNYFCTDDVLLDKEDLIFDEHVYVVDVQQPKAIPTDFIDPSLPDASAKVIVRRCAESIFEALYSVLDRAFIFFAPAACENVNVQVMLSYSEMACIQFRNQKLHGIVLGDSFLCDLFDRLPSVPPDIILDQFLSHVIYFSGFYGECRVDLHLIQKDVTPPMTELFIIPGFKLMRKYLKLRLFVLISQSGDEIQKWCDVIDIGSTRSVSFLMLDWVLCAELLLLFVVTKRFIV